MTEKEKKEILGNIVPNFNTNLANGTITMNLDYYNCLEEYIRRILDELEQKDKEIQELKEKWDKDTHTLQNQLDLANADRVEKDKIIKLTARYINSTDKVEDVCRETGDTYNCTEYRDCEECIIEFFKKKAREENE